ncbi:MAG: serine--tRNA ligase [Candidatus Asgardarchaeia archaeon]
MWSMLYYLRNNPEKIKWSQRHRGLDDSVVDKAIEYDKKWRKELQKLNELQRQRNELSKQIGKVKDPNERKILIEKAKAISNKIEEQENVVEQYLKLRDEILLGLPNIVHETVPIGKDETENVPVRFYGKPKVYSEFVNRFLEETNGFNVEYEIIDWKPLSHYDLGEKLKFVDTARAAKVAGARFFYILDDLVWLDFALIMFAIDELSKLGFHLVQPPYMLKYAPYSGVTSITDFEDALYKIENEDLYLIATSEHPIAARFMNETLEIGDLPLTYIGISPCFRKEAGAHGKDTKGIFRVHQFHKVEQFVFTLPEDSWEWHEKLIKNAELLFQKLELPYRIVNICTGDLGVVAAKKYDLEVWMPGQGKFREMVSCSNCTDYQSYRLNIRYAEKRGYPSKGFVHTLNSTAIATTRAITAILENYQEPDGTVKIPNVLKKYLEPFDAAPKDEIKPLDKFV